MADSADLDRLAARYGILPEYVDLFGQKRVASQETKRALLAAMNIPCADDREIAASLQEAVERPWRRLVPPVVVCDEDTLPSVPVSLMVDGAERRLDWTVIEEGGERHQGTLLVDDAEVAGSETFGDITYERRALAFPVVLASGYHRLRVSLDGGEDFEASLIVAPKKCFGTEDAIDDARVWGLGLQLYGLRSTANWGMGDFTDLARLANDAARLGASFLGLNPLHALFPADANHFGPYGPSTRLFLNILYVDPEAVPEFAEAAEARAIVDDPAFAERLESLRETAFVDYPAVSDLKLPVLEALYRHFRQRHLADPQSPRAQSFAAFRRDMGQPLRWHATFDALHEHFFTNDPDRWFWRTWPAEYQDHTSPEVAAFAEENDDRVTFFEYLQWLADEQLAAAARKAEEGGMPIGLFRDLAVAVHPGGSMAWSFPQALMHGASIGAPPDDFNLLGQNWGLAGVSPDGLRETAFEPFIAALRANMRHAGAIRIDHVLALRRLYWIPDGAKAGSGAYIAYPFHDMLRVLALESWRNRCLVVGEDLGTVPEGLRSDLHEAEVLSYRVLLFERDDNGFRPPETYPEKALAVVSTHDLPTIEGYWRDRDIEWRVGLGYWPTDKEREAAFAARTREREELIAALKAADVLPPDRNYGTTPQPLPEGVLEAVHHFLARSPARLFMVQMEDAAGEVEQANLPGTFKEHPNWCRRIGLALEDIPRDERLARLARLLTDLRPPPRGDRPGG